jgi:methyl-accepting chemotaxis protein
MQWFNNLRFHSKVRVSFIAVSLILIAIFASAFWGNAEKMAMDEIDTKLLTAIHAVEFSVDPKVHQNVGRSGKDDSFGTDQSLMLTKLSKKLGLPYLYTFVLNESGDVVFATSSLTDDELSKGVNYYLHTYDNQEAKDIVKSVLLTGATGNLEYSSADGEFRTLYVRAIAPNGDKYVIAADADLKDVTEARKRVVMEVALVGGVAFIIALLAAFLLGNLVSRSLNSFLQALNDLSSGQGDLTRMLPVNSKDETGQMAVAFNRFVGDLREMFAVIRDEATKLKTGFHDMSQMMRVIHADSQEQSDKATTTAATIEEITATMHNIAESTHETARVVQESSEKSQSSSKAVGAVAGEIEAISNQVNDLSQVISNLQARSKDISNIVDVIRSIADQTNLLALNAAIEAARAGESGRGFAVVADEVRTLASRTSTATVQIADMIKAVGEETAQATQRMAKTSHSVNNGVLLSDQAITQIEGIRADMNSIVEKIQVINHATSEQSQATAEMAKAAESISAGSQQSRDVIQEAQHSLIDLDKVVVSLNQMVGKFRIS